MTQHPTLECEACNRRFEAQLPMGPRAFARSRLMFLVDRCPFCRESRTYMRSAFRFDTARELVGV